MLSAIPIVLLATNAPVPAAVSVDTSRIEATGWKGEEVRQLRGSLLARLLEQGYRVAPGPQDAQIRLAVLKSGEGFVVEATAASHREYRIDPGPSAVVSLEILHRATMVVDEVRGSVTREGGARVSLTNPSDVGGVDRPLTKRSVSIEVTGPPEDVTASRLREELAVTLSSSGLMLVPRSVPHDRTVCVTVDADQVTLATGAGSTSCGAPALKLARTALSRDELAAHIRGHVSRLLPTEATSDAVSHAEPVGERPSGDKTKSPLQTQAVRADRGWLLGFGVGAGILSRTGANDPLLQGDVDLRWPSGWGARLLGSFSYSTGAPTLAISETSIQIGPTFSLPLTTALAVHFGLLGGVRIHHYSYRSTDNGSRVGYDFALPAQMTLDLGASWVLGLTVFPGLTGPTRDHEIAGTIVWSRSPAYLGLTAGIGVVL